MEISILVLTYNHEKYVKQTIDSIMMQKIDVPYEIIILDDASTDNTPNILKEYKKKYPQKISLYLRKFNSGCPTKNGYFLLSKAKGAFYACIEGDDYWIDPFKIQKQYDFLKRHKEYSGCMTDYIVVDEKNDEIEKKFYEKKENHIYTLDDFRHLRLIGMTVTFLARNYFDEEEYRILFKIDKMMGDITSYMLCLLKGDIYQLDEVTSAYRYVSKDGKGNFNSIHQGNIYKSYMMIRYWIGLENYMRNYEKDFEFVPMVDNIVQIIPQYSIKSMFSLLMKSKNRKKYLQIYLAKRFLLDSKFLCEGFHKGRQKCYNWHAFQKDKKPIILFGAGAVAEEYLDKYAWRNNILFIVDNDKYKQNTSYKGFLIKSPEEIIRYKNKAKVLIVNQKYESEIETQLLDMAVPSYYCYCSMQSNRFRNILANKIFKYYKNY